MIVRRIEVIDARESRERGYKRYSLAGFFLSLPWCCITPATLSLLGFFGAAGATRLVFIKALFPLFIVSLLHFIFHSQQIFTSPRRFSNSY